MKMSDGYCHPHQHVFFETAGCMPLRKLGTHLETSVSIYVHLCCAYTYIQVCDYILVQNVPLQFWWQHCCDFIGGLFARTFVF